MKSYSVIFVLSVALSIVIVNCAVIESEDVDQQGLYDKKDHVIILTNKNFDRKVYGKDYAIVVQFYNSYCGHCRAFSPKFKSFVLDTLAWKDIIQFAVLDCSVEENNEICRQFEVMQYPSLRYLHENYVKSNANVGDKLSSIETANALKEEIIHKLHSEKAMGRLSRLPPLTINSYSSLTSALKDVSSDVIYTFLVFEKENSTTGTELILDTNDYQHFRLKRINEESELATITGVKNFPGLVAVSYNLEPTNLTPKSPTGHNLLNAMNMFLKSNNYEFPLRSSAHVVINGGENPNENLVGNADVIYYADLEMTLKNALHIEITRYKVLSGEPLQALMKFLDVIITSFPFRANSRYFIVELYNTLATKNEWHGGDMYNLIEQLENKHAPVYLQPEYVSCKGSLPMYRGYTCGLWTLFHTLTVNAAQKSGTEAPKVLKAMHGYIKYFFGCTDCSQHFQDMASKNRLFDVKDNEKAVLWLWIAHNEVNLRLAGDVTEDPSFPKIQFPKAERCPNCRLSRGAWNLPVVLSYLQSVYNADNIHTSSLRRMATEVPSQFSKLDIGLLSLLYILSFLILIIVIKLFFTKRYYRKRVYKHDGLGKV